ncbi:hypothetical protein [Aidingimonas lacisalsi]|nr:hypothetical protein [Aidingimonas lacisalsi]
MATMPSGTMIGRVGLCRLRIEPPPKLADFAIDVQRYTPLQA